VQLQQVVLNLAINAIEAMRSVTDRPRVLQIDELQQGPEEVLVSVSDSGAGYAEEHAERVRA
jgi:C4-dicarboxylate-specific signal transduction histidine kinase